MPITRRTALKTGGVGALAALLPPLIGPVAAQSGDLRRTLSRAYNASGAELFKQLNGAGGNLVFSPYSIGTAMAMVLAGARGATERQMAEALWHSLPRTEINKANAEVLATLKGYDRSAAVPSCPPGLNLVGENCTRPWTEAEGCRYPARRDADACVATPVRPPSAELSVADALMLTGRGEAISSEYRALLKQDYAAEVFENANLGDINAWVARQTHGKIARILDQLDPNAKAVLLNAVYFKARWAAVFSRSQTRDEPFHLTAAQAVPVPTMRQRGGYAMVARDGYRALRMPYEIEALGLIVVLPDAVEGVAKVGAGLDEAQLSELFTALRGVPVRQVELSLPRFKIESRLELVPLFKQVGMTLPFSDQADFGGMTARPQERIAISEIVHRAVIDVTEEGTEAAAATAITMMGSSMPSKIEEFRVDRPFLFYLVDDATGAILFEGRINDPR